jgi:hypothetical protein
MSSTLSEIINRRKGTPISKQAKSSPPIPEEKKESSSFGFWIAVVVAVIVLILIFIWYWYSPSESPKNAILKEMRDQKPDTIGRNDPVEGTMSLQDFRDYHSRFSLPITKETS